MSDLEESFSIIFSKEKDSSFLKVWYYLGRIYSNMRRWRSDLIGEYGGKDGHLHSVLYCIAIVSIYRKRWVPLV